MIHEMKLKEKHFNYIKEGTKRIELRLFDEKRSKIKIGDTIRFLKEPELNEFIDTKVIGLLRYDSFDSLFKDFDIKILADESTSKNNLKNDLEQFYTNELQKQYGVLGIRIELI